MAITIDNLRIVPYTQKNTIKPVFGDTMTLTFTLPEPYITGDEYILGLDYERVLIPTAREVCALTDEYTIDGDNITFELLISTARFRDWVSSIKKPMPIWLQMQRVRDGIYETILLDDILALPSVIDGSNTVFHGDPLEDLLAEKLDKPTEEGEAGQVLTLGEDGEPVWDDSQGGGGAARQATDAEIDARTSTRNPITPNNLNYAVKAALSDGQHIMLTDEEQAAVKEVLDIPTSTDYIPQTDKGAANGVASLDSNGTVPVAELPALAPLPLHLDAAPTTSTVGVFGQHAIVDSTGKEYTCVAVTTADDVTTYTWEDCVNAKGGTFTGDLYFGGIPSWVQTGMLISSDYDHPCIYMQHGSVAQASSRAAMCISLGSNVMNSYNTNRCICVGTSLKSGGSGHLFLGTFNEYPSDNGPFHKSIVVGDGTADNARHDCFYVKDDGDVFAGSYSEAVTIIPAATTSYTLSEGCFSHAPDAASTYTFPAITDTTRTHECILDVLFTGYARSTTDDGTGYYAWKDTKGNLLYTSTDSPTAGTTEAFTDTALSTSAGTIALYDSASSSIAMVGTYSFEDSAGNTITPLSTPDIKPGSVVTFLCRWSALLEQWTIMPVPQGVKLPAAEVTP